MLLTDLLDTYAASNPRLTKADSVRRYRTTAVNYGKYFRRDATTADLTDDNYGKWINWRRQSTTAAAGTIRGDAEKLLVLWRYAAKRELAPAPNVVLPHPAALEPVAWTKAEMAQLEKAARDSKRTVGGFPGSIFWPAILGVALDTGERIKAIHAVDACDIDLGRRLIVFRREHRKGSRSDNIKQLSRPTVRALAELLKHRPALPFQVIKYNSLYTPMRWLLVDAGLPTDRRRMFHCLRRTHATRVHLQGGDATASLGHADPRTTRAYIDRSQLPQMTPDREGLAGWLARKFGRVARAAG